MDNRIPQPAQHHWYSRWWFWSILIVIVIVVAAVSAGMIAYKQYQLHSLEYLREEVGVEKRDIRKTISTSGTIVPDGTTALRVTAPAAVTAVHATASATVSKNDTLIETSAGAIVAPFDGRVLAVHTFVGDLASPAVPVIELATRTTHVEFLASDSEVLELAPHMTAQLTIPALDNSEQVFTGEVLTIGAQKEIGQHIGGSATAEAGYPITISLGDIPESTAAFAGVSVDIEIIVAERQQSIAVISGAVQYDDDQAFVYLVPTIDDEFVQEAMAADDVTTLLQKKNVTIGFQGDEYVEVTEGLQEGDAVLLYVPAQSGSAL